MLDEEDINWAGRNALRFAVTWLVVAVGISVLLLDDYSLFLSIPTIPTLTAMYFVYSEDRATRNWGHKKFRLVAARRLRNF